MNKHFLLDVSLALGLAGLLFSTLLSVTHALPDARPANVAPQVWEATVSDEAEFLVILDEQADLSAAATLLTREARLRYVYDTLRRLALRSQASLRAELDAAGASYRSFYIVNMLVVKGDRALVARLAARSEVARIAANPRVRQSLPTPSPPPPVPPAPPQSPPKLGGTEGGRRPPSPLPQSWGRGRGRGPATVEWGVARVNADDVWALGYTGQSIVVAGQDTGYDWEHPALVNQYRGYNGVTATHDYNWHDAIHSGGGSCGADSSEPCDDHGHGTHTMGTIVGDDGGNNQVGVAPGARWIGCRNMNVGVGTPATYIECFEFFIAPYPLGGDPLTDGDPSLAPHVINNSWTCPSSEGCDWDTLQRVVTTTRAAGIVVVASAGNSGSGCSTVGDPPALYDAAFSVGATNSSDNIASFSSRGPVTVDGSGRLKPDVSAPGVSVRSSRRGGGYTSMSGTSMAGPHVVGVAALLWSAAPVLIGDVDGTEQIITHTARPRTTTQGCGGDGPDDVPNNVYGWGIVDALAAVQEDIPGLAVAQQSHPDSVQAGARLTYTLYITNTGTVTLTAAITDLLPIHVTPTGTLTWTPIPINRGGVWTETVVVTVEVDCVGPLTNVVRVTTDEGATGAYTYTLAPGLDITQQVASDPVLSGGQVTFTIFITNTGDFVLHAIVTDTLPGHVTPTGILTWTPGPLAPDGVWTETVVVTVEVGYTGLLTNVVRVTTGEGATGVYTATTTALVTALMVSKRAYPDPVWAGAQLTYTLRVANTGTATLTAAITDFLPAHVTPGGVLTWMPVSIAPGGVWTETVVVTVEIDYTGPLTNVVQVTTEEGATGVYTVTVLSLAPRLEATKQATFPSGFPVRLLVYTLTVTNTSLSTLTQIILTDTIPVSATFAWASGDYTLADGIVTWAAARLSPQSALTTTLAVAVEHLPSGLRVVNTEYGVRADELFAPVMGAPVEAVIPWRYTFPIFLRNWSPGENNGD